MQEHLNSMGQWLLTKPIATTLKERGLLEENFENLLTLCNVEDNA